MNISIRLLKESEIPEADRIFRLAFGTFTKLPEPTQFGGDANYIQHRWWREPTAAFASVVDGKIVGSNLGTNWGSCSFFGPLSVHPDLWNQGVAKHLIAAVIERFKQWGTTQAGLFTFPNSPLHHALYQKFGFWPRFLTAIMAKEVQIFQPELQFSRYSQINVEEQANCLNASRELTNTICEGLDLFREIQVVEALKLGDTIFLWDEKGLAGLAVCHWGAGTEGGSNTCYVKFGAVRSGTNAAERFEQLLSLCETLSVVQGMSRLVAGVNTSRHEAYRRMLDRGFRTIITGVAMHKPNEPSYNRPDVFALDDWR